METEIKEIEELIKQFSKLPGLGPKSAKRIILKLINNKELRFKISRKSKNYIEKFHEKENILNNMFSEVKRIISKG